MFMKSFLTLKKQNKKTQQLPSLKFLMSRTVGHFIKTSSVFWYNLEKFHSCNFSTEYNSVGHFYNGALMQNSCFVYKIYLPY